MTNTTNIKFPVTVAVTTTIINLPDARLGLEKGSSVGNQQEHADFHH